MADAAAPAAGNQLAENLRSLRERRGETQAQVARRAGVPRATYAHLESGGANPTLAALTRVATALDVGLEELLAKPRALGRLIRAHQIAVQRRGSVAVRKLLPDPLPSLDLERMELAPGARMKGVPHTAGSREYLTCESGAIEGEVAAVAYSALRI